MIKLFRTLPYILLLLNLVFIFGNSVLSGPQSLAISAKAEEAIEQVVGAEFENDPKEPFAFKRTFNAFLRKSAHALEFCSLGVLASICIRSLSVKTRVFSLIIFGLSVPLFDETIQLFSQRSAMVKDMWIDIFGFVSGCILALAAQSVSHFIKKRQVK